MLLLVCVMAVLPSALGSPLFNLDLVDQLQTRLEQNETADSIFEDFKDVFNKSYEDEMEETRRRNIFALNVDYIRDHNRLYARGERSSILGINHFADLTLDEFVLRYTGLNPDMELSNGSLWMSPSNNQLPAFRDWRRKGYVTPVKNQRQCGSCWAFSTTGALEGQVAKTTHQLVSLSEQQLVDCSTSNYGCGGGLPINAYDYIKNVGGLESETNYPYTAKDMQCRFNRKLLVPGTALIGYTSLPRGNEATLKSAVATVGPISVAIDASHKSFQFHKYGVYFEPSCSSDSLDHAVLAVGYGTSFGKDYWLVKNSWGTTWGDRGYIKMARNRNNNCGIATMTSYPLVQVKTTVDAIGPEIIVKTIYLLDIF